MQGSDSQPRFEARPAGPLGEGWNVHVFWSAGKTNVIPGFANQYQALDWIKTKSANWVVDRLISDSKI